MRVIVATNNHGKLAELRELMPDGIELVTLAVAGLSSPAETGSTFAANALIKARAAAAHADGALADDSGLVVDALNGEPGVRSARYAGERATDGQNNQKLLAALNDRALNLPYARFVCAAAFVTASGAEWLTEGIVEGKIIGGPRGTEGFGYDPLFEIDDPGALEMRGQTLAELTIEDKNRISHRSRAVRALIHDLRVAGMLPR